MNKYLMMSAAALLATTALGSSEASAATFDVHFGTSGGGSYCDGLRGYVTPSYDVGSHVLTTCGYSVNSPIFGIPTKSKGIGKNVDFVLSSTSSESVSVDVGAPLKAGKKWALYVCFGRSCFIDDEGVLLPGQYAKVPGKHAPSVASKLAEVVQQRAPKNR